jgi:1,2-diacylglycerol 3-beta-glucosyltransferase
VILQLLTWLATAGIISIFVHAVRLWLVSRPAAVPPATAHAAADGFLFTFVVPALNEARVIEHTLDRLLSLPVRHCLVLVIDDGSDDGTGHLVESHRDPRVRLLRREFPDARRGKGAALNAGFHRLLQEVGNGLPTRSSSASWTPTAGSTRRPRTGLPSISRTPTSAPSR